MDQKDIITIVFSSASLVISIISLALGILNYRREGGALKVSLDFEQTTLNGALVLKIENKGYHSVTITGIFLLAGKARHAVEDQNIELKYGAHKVIHIGLARYQLDTQEVTAVEVEDVSGKIMRVSTRSLRGKIQKRSVHLHP